RDGDLVELGAADERRDFTRRNLQINHRAVAHVGAPARHPVCEIAVALEVVAPGFTPPRARDGATCDGDGRNGASLLLELGDLGRHVGPPLLGGDIRTPIVVESHVHPSSMARRMSSDTRSMISSSTISVSSASPPASSSSFDKAVLDSMSASIFS